jgi:hypothetical protein
MPGIRRPAVFFVTDGMTKVSSGGEGDLLINIKTQDRLEESKLALFLQLAVLVALSKRRSRTTSTNF